MALEFLDIEKTVRTYRKDSVYRIPFSAFEHIKKDSRFIYLYAVGIKDYIECENLDRSVITCYNSENFIVTGSGSMKYKIAVKIPYESRSKCFPVIYEINECVGVEGFVVLAVNNLPYSLESFLIIETETAESLKQVKGIVSVNGLALEAGIDLNIVTEAMGARQYNLVSFVPNEAFDFIKMKCESLYCFPEKEEFEFKGYGFRELKKKKVFISYSHKDKQVVRGVVNELKDRGLDVWIDEGQIDIGDDILEKIHAGIRECDVHAIFLSENFKDSFFAKYELSIFFRNAILNKGSSRKWFPIKLDDVDLEEIMLYLGGYLYFDMRSRSVDDLILELETALGY